MVGTCRWSFVGNHVVALLQWAYSRRLTWNTQSPKWALCNYRLWVIRFHSTMFLIATDTPSGEEYWWFLCLWTCEYNDHVMSRIQQLITHFPDYQFIYPSPKIFPEPWVFVCDIVVPYHFRVSLNSHLVSAFWPVRNLYIDCYHVKKKHLWPELEPTWIYGYKI